MTLVHIKRVSDGVERIYHEDPWDEFIEYLWSEGNYGCDCNRYIFFNRLGREDPWDEHFECGATAFLIRITEEDGTELYRDDEWVDK